VAIHYDVDLMSAVDRALRVLDLEAGASEAEITRAYKDLVRVWHPDRHGADPALQARAEEKLKEITRAYEVLKSSGSGGRRARPPAGGGTVRAGTRGAPAPKAGFFASTPPWVLLVLAIALVAALRSGRIIPGLGILAVYLIVLGLRRLVRGDA
jgi:hypothetical protein